MRRLHDVAAIGDRRTVFSRVQKPAISGCDYLDLMVSYDVVRSRTTSLLLYAQKLVYYDRRTTVVRPSHDRRTTVVRPSYDFTRIVYREAQIIVGSPDDIA